MNYSTIPAALQLAHLFFLYSSPPSEFILFLTRCACLFHILCSRFRINELHRPLTFIFSSVPQNWTVLLFHLHFLLQKTQSPAPLAIIMSSTTIRALNDETFQDLVYIQRCAAERISWIAAYARAYRQRTYHAKKIALFLGLKVNTQMARNCPQIFVSKDPLPEIIVPESPSSPSLGLLQGPQLAPQPRKPTIVIPAIGSARRPIPVLLSPSAVWAPALGVVELPSVDDDEEWMSEIIFTPIESDSSGKPAMPP
jgi:hypothetical protein